MPVAVIPDLDSHLEAKMQPSTETDPRRQVLCIPERWAGAGTADPPSGSGGGKWAIGPADSTQREWESHHSLIPFRLVCSFEMSPFSTHHNSKQFLHFKKVISEK